MEWMFEKSIGVLAEHMTVKSLQINGTIFALCALEKPMS